MAEIHQNDIGTTLQLTIQDEDGGAINLAGATDHDVIIERPDRSVFTRDALVVSESLGQISYTTASGDLPIAGVYQIQAHIITASENWKTEVARFVVHRNLA